MKTVKIIARQDIINASTHKLFDDDGLKALDSYFECFVNVEDEHDVVAIEKQFIKDNPKFKDSNIELVVLDT